MQVFLPKSLACLVTSSTSLLHWGTSARQLSDSYSYCFLKSELSLDLLPQCPLSSGRTGNKRCFLFLSPSQGSLSAFPVLPDNPGSLYPSLIYSEQLTPPGNLENHSPKQPLCSRCLFLDSIKPTSDFFCCLSLSALSLLFERQQALLSLKFSTVWLAHTLNCTALECTGAFSSLILTKLQTTGNNLYTIEVETIQEG